MRAFHARGAVRDPIVPASAPGEGSGAFVVQLHNDKLPFVVQLQNGEAAFFVQLFNRR
jgi:hypothetical protein